MTRVCNKCKEEKPAAAEYFPVARKLPLGINYTCRPCDRERVKAYLKANRSVNNRAGAKYRAARISTDPETFRAENAEKAKRWREANPQRAAVVKRHYRQNHPGQERDWNNRYRARKHAATIETINYAAIVERDQDVCHICGIETDSTGGMYSPLYHTFDHVIPLSRGGDHSMQNLKVAHRVCNLRKNNALSVITATEETA